MALEPITRAEQIMSGQSLTPITREEMFLAKAGGQNVTTPKPITRREMFLSKISGSSGGGGNTGGDEGWIGDGNTHIWISLAEGRTSPMLGCCPKGTVTVDWGDGTAPDVLTGTSLTAVKWTPTHEYAKAGDYVITLTVEGEMGFSYVSIYDKYATILRHSDDADGRNRTYQIAVKKAEIGDSVPSISDGSFYSCYSLAAITIPESVTSIGGSAFYNCYSLAAITIPKGVTSIGSGAFYNCYSLAVVTIPESVTSIGGSAFGYCASTRYYDFTNHTSVPTIENTNAFLGIPADCEIRVPAALYDEWIAATNWATYASYIKAV
jgi:hypothetical protein